MPTHSIAIPWHKVLYCIIIIQGVDRYKSSFVCEKEGSGSDVKKKKTQLGSRKTNVRWDRITSVDVWGQLCFLMHDTIVQTWVSVLYMQKIVDFYVMDVARFHVSTNMDDFNWLLLNCCVFPVEPPPWSDGQWVVNTALPYYYVTCVCMGCWIQSIPCPANY